MVKKGRLKAAPEGGPEFPAEQTRKNTQIVGVVSVDLKSTQHLYFATET